MNKSTACIPAGTDACNATDIRNQALEEAAALVEQYSTIESPNLMASKIRTLMDPASLNQYPNGTDLLWMASFRSSPGSGDMDGISRKLSGTLEEAAEEVQRLAVEEGLILQCLWRRF
jgi:hypothetical protein